jgi:CheY-like chemotaxis protein
MRYGDTVDILLVEDDSGDVELTREALRDSKLTLKLHVVEDGEKALQFMRREKPYEDMPRPDLVLLDLNLPRIDGREVLKIVKADEKLRDIPIVVVTTSDAEADIVRSYNLGANCYITKPIGLDQFLNVVKALEDFWFTVVKLPSGKQAGSLFLPRPEGPQTGPSKLL